MISPGIEAARSNSAMPATGEFILPPELLSAPAVRDVSGLCDFSLNYLSNNGVDYIVGLNWNHSQRYRLSQLPNGGIVVATPDSLQETSISNDNGQVPPSKMRTFQYYAGYLKCEGRVPLGTCKLLDVPFAYDPAYTPCPGPGGATVTVRRVNGALC